MKKVDEGALANGRREKLLDYNAYAAEADDLIARIIKTNDRFADPIWCQGKDTATILRMTGARAEYAPNLLAQAPFYPRALMDFAHQAANS